MSTDLCRWFFLLLFSVSWTKYSNSKEIRVVCYYTNWSVYRPGTAKFSPQNINPYLCTHLIYAFGGFTKENTLKPFDKYQDIEKGGYAKFTGLKTYNKNLKTMLAIGGWNEGSSRFSPMVANPDRRKELIKNAIKFLRQNHFDGLDLDWEYPSFRDGGKSRDRDNYAQLVQEMREEFERESEKTGRPRLLLTMAVPAGIEYINKGYDVPKLTKYLDWMNILSYDYHSAFEPAANHHAPLYPLEEPSEYSYDTELNIDYTIKHYLEKGADPSKLVLGIPTYGRSYTLFNPDANEIGAPADGPGDMGEATRENGYLAYYEICENIKSQSWTVVHPNPDAMGPYAYKDKQWVGYDDDGIARKKAEYVAENSLGGIMFWSIDNDDFRGTCHGKPYPIIEAAKEALISAYGLTDENLVSPSTKPTKSRTRTRTQTSSKSSTDNDEDKKKSSNSSSTRRNRLKSKTDRTNSRTKNRRKEQSRTTEGTVYSSLELVTPSYTTPAPPPTPDMGGEFKCEDEGFYPHPRDCKKYYWCLSGPGELGIVAHQFTCPAGLYFNKAADSCDYTRNVLCSKKLKTTTTTTTTTQATTSKTSTSTTRVPSKITAATSRTTIFRTSTTTEPYEEEDEEYEDDDEEEDSKNSEEDPKVIKELLDLIKRAGGIEELEKQLKIHEDGSASVSNSDTTTPSSISKSLVERVLGKAAKNRDAGKRKSFFHLNSRGPQNEGLTTTEDKKQDKGRPKYTTITRQRTQKSEEENDNKEDEESSRHSSKKQPEYVNIRRGKGSSTTEESDDDARTQINRNKILGEEDSDDIDDEEGSDDAENNKQKTTNLQYVNIRRQRPSTTEETSTTKYTIIRRGSTTEATESEDSTSKNTRRTTVSEDQGPTTEKYKYKILRRGSSTETPTTTDNKNLSSDDTVSATQTSESDSDVNPTTVDDQISVATTESLPTRSTASVSVSKLPPKQSNFDSKLIDSTDDTKEGVSQTPLLLEPRPFSLSTNGPSSSIKPITETSTRVTKVSESDYKLRTRQKVAKTQTTTVKPTSVRTRAPSRYRQSTTIELDYLTTTTNKPLVRSRKRFSTTTQRYLESDDESDLGRTYRPSEIADLSSLTAVDFETLKELNRFNSKSRQRRPRPSSTTTKPEDVEDNVKTASRTLPLSRKPVDNRRNTSYKKDSEIEDQVNSSSDTARRIRPFTRTTSTTEEPRSQTHRNRKVIRRLRPTTNRQRSTTESENLIENASSSSLYRRRLTRPAINTAQEINNLSTRASKTTENSRLQSSATNDEANETSEDVSGEEGENIKLSESNIRENSDVNNNNNNNLNPDDGKKIRKRVLKRIRNKIDEDKSTTEPNVIIRTRKIIRKLTPTESTLPSVSTTKPSTEGRKRKIIRRLKPTSTPIVTSRTEKAFSRGSPFLQNAQEEIENGNNDKYYLTKAKYKSLTRNQQQEKIGESSPRTIDRSKYSTFNRGTTTEKYLKEQEKEEKLYGEKINRSKYKIYGPTTFHDEDGEEDEDYEENADEEPDVFKDAIKLRILKPVAKQATEDDDNLTINEEDKRENNDEESEESQEEDHNNDEVSTEETYDESEEESTTTQEEIVTTTPKPYVNPILVRQKNRPAYIRPKLTTPSTLQSSTTTRSKYKSFTRSTTPTHMNNTTTEKPFEVKPTEKEVITTVVNGMLEEKEQTKITDEAKLEVNVTDSEFYNATTESGDENTTEVIEITTLEIPIAIDGDIGNETITAASQLENATKSLSQSDISTTVIPQNEAAYTEKITTIANNIIFNGDNETMVNTTESTIKKTDETTTENNSVSTTENSTTKEPIKVEETTSSYQPRSTLKSLKERPKFSPKRLTTETPKTSTKSLYSKLQQRNRSYPGSSKLLTPNFKSTTPSPLTVNKFSKYNKEKQEKDNDDEEDGEVTEDEDSVETLRLLTKSLGSTTPSLLVRNRFKYKLSKSDKQEQTEDNDEESGDEADKPRSSNTPKISTKVNKPRVSNNPGGYRFRKTTEAPKTSESLGDIDTEAVKNRNKNLFSKKRKMNTPFAGHQNVNTTEIPSLTTTPIISESVTKPMQDFETTEYLTTLHHVFAETELIFNSTTTPFSPVENATNATNTKVEKLIEVNRIVEVHDVNDTNVKKDNKIIDKVGVINRVTVVKVVGDPKPEENEVTSKSNNEEEIATVKEIPNPGGKNLFDILSPQRENRKFEIYGASKVADYSSKDIKSTGKESAQIIDGISNINVITPRPYYSTEASTIALEALFSQNPNNINANLAKSSNDDELLETGNSRFVNVRILGNEKTEKEIKDESQIVPVRIPKEDDYITMKAEVVEVTPKISQEMIKIVPIKVEMSRKLLVPADFHTKIENGIPKVNLQILKTKN